MMKRFFLLLTIFLSTELFSTSSYYTQYFEAPNIQFSQEVFDALLKKKQLQTLRNYFYNLPQQKTLDDPINDTHSWLEQLDWLKEAACKDPSLAYIAARTLKERFDTLEWQFYIHLALLYIAVCSTQCFNQQILQVKCPFETLRKHAQSHGYLNCTEEEKKNIKAELRQWRKSFKSWNTLPSPAWIFCLRTTHYFINLFSYTSIVYDLYQEDFEKHFYTRNTQLIDAISEEAYKKYLDAL